MPVQGTRPRPALRQRTRPARRGHPPLHEGRPVNGTSTLLIIIGLFLAGGVWSFVKQGMPKSLLAMLSVGAGVFLIAGVLNLTV
ncbi:predicted protein [Streptomyces sp. SPB78]|nr:predicted protein [Streptomyces sp. SPB78]